MDIYLKMGYEFTDDNRDYMMGIAWTVFFILLISVTLGIASLIIDPNVIYLGLGIFSFAVIYAIPIILFEK